MKDYEKKAAHCYSEWGQIYFDEYYGKDAPYPPVHVPLIIKLLNDSSVSNVLDAGCGPASFLRYLFDQDKIRLYGFDLTPEMVIEAKRIFEVNKYSPENVWEGSVLNPKSYTVPSENLSTFDSIVCSGVLPHIAEEDEDKMLSNMKASLRPGGTLILEGRNQFFSLFTLNRYSYEFLVKDLIQFEKLKTQVSEEQGQKLDSIKDRMQDQFKMDLPPIRKGYADEPGYDEILSRTHNPFVLRNKLASHGFKEIEFKFYHYHPVPPIFKGDMPELFIDQAMKMEDPDDWRGFFMASAFYLVAKV